MWLVIPKVGFLNVVQDRNDLDGLLVRARSLTDLPRLRSLYMPSLRDFTAKETRDYPYQARISKVDFGSGMAKVALDITYDKTKSELFTYQGSYRTQIATKVWGVLFDLQDMPGKFVTKGSDTLKSAIRASNWIKSTFKVKGKPSGK